MIINSIEVKGLYGHMDKKIDFYNDISLLVGINGSGKTSVLNIINWLLTPSFGFLCVTEFDYIKLSFVLKSKEYLVECTQEETKLEYKISNQDYIYNPITFLLRTPSKQLRNNEDTRNSLIDLYNGMTPDEDEIFTYNFISREIPNPINIGLDRSTKIVDVEYDSSDLERRSKSSKRNSPPDLPLHQIKNLINLQYRRNKNSILNLSNNLKNQLVLSAFDGSITENSITQVVEANAISLRQIEAIEKGVYKYFSDIDSSLSHQNENQLIKKYFSQLKHVIRNYENDKENNLNKILFNLNANQFHKLTNILSEFRSYENKSTKIMRQINLFLETTNYFLKDSAKQILFKEDTSEVCYNSVDRDNKKVLVKYQDIVNLSSGEKQLLILFSLLAFNVSHDRIFIIDEPELSLHIKWQEDFLSALEKVAPNGTQIILATHSPILVSKKKKNTILLLPYNN